MRRYFFKRTGIMLALAAMLFGLGALPQAHASMHGGTLRALSSQAAPPCQAGEPSAVLSSADCNAACTPGYGAILPVHHTTPGHGITQPPTPTENKFSQWLPPPYERPPRI